ncbi:recombination protein NinB [Mixta sp. Marseille-Q2659]|uniref:recombination protein NinB n=1 Tax=Mixta sp. Marseille-Q2659 TaxID=2736607 RepID=UPI0023B8959B|nr:recombination protein NinB [Mixta sp. Marseille-Q2659]
MEKQTYLIRDNRIRQNCIEAIQNLPTNTDRPLQIIIQEDTRSLAQNAKLHAMLTDVSRQAVFMGKKRSVEYWKSLFVSGWQIATGQNPEIVPGLEGEFINIRESTAKMSVKKLSGVIEYIHAYCAMNDISLRAGDYYE